MKPPKLPQLDRLKRWQLWVLWRAEKKKGQDKPAKIPYDPRKTRVAKRYKSLDDCGTYETAASALRESGKKFSGLGIQIVGGMLGVDVDDCVAENGTLKLWSRKIVEFLSARTYGELSPSATGIKFLFMLQFDDEEIEGHPTRFQRSNSDERVEVYSRRRFFTLTGRSYTDHDVSGLSREDFDQLMEMCHDICERRKKAERKEERGDGPPSMPDEEILRIMASSKSWPKFKTLWDGGSVHGGDDSSDDLAMADQLAFYTWDEDQLERLMRESERFREKWDSQRPTKDGSGYTTWLRKEIVDKAVDDCEEHYQPRELRNERARKEGKPATLNPNIPTEVAGEYLAVHGQTRFRDSEFRRWNGKFYEMTEQGRIEMEISSILKNSRNPEGEPVIAFPAYVTQAVAAIKQHSDCWLDRSVKPPYWLDGEPERPPSERMMVFRNGVLDWKTRKFYEHDAALYCENALPYDYDPDARCPKWRAFLRTLWKDHPDQVRLLRMWFGYVLSRRTDQQKILLIIGPPRAGKGIITHILSETIGEESTAQHTMQDMAEQFGLQGLLGKDLVTITDARIGRNVQDGLQRLLAISGGDVVNIPRKYKDELSERLGCRFMFCTNEVPRFADASGALASRFVTLKMTKSFLGQEDLGLHGRLRRELPGILNWSLRGLRMLDGEGEFMQPKSSASVQRDMRDLGSPLRQFLREECDVQRQEDVSPDLRFSSKSAPVQWEVDCQELYLAYENWCQATGHRTSSMTLFGRDLKTIHGWIVRKKKRGGGYVYRGIRLRDSQDVSEIKSRMNGKG